ncbi:MAG: hypothetical protein R3C11_07455 [Planctomycetaceae bacterium]
MERGKSTLMKVLEWGCMLLIPARCCWKEKTYALGMVLLTSAALWHQA